jgi:endo-1,4-beta-xylanase
MMVRKAFCFMVVPLCVIISANAQMAADKCKYLGNIISVSVPSDFTTYWNQVTPENAGKWGSVEGTRDQMSWTGLDNAYQYAKQNGLPFKQHTFVWGQQQPAWLSGLSFEEQKAEVEEWISEFCSRYPETDFIDVVNEPIHAQPTYKNAIGGNGVTGWDWVIWSFEKARQYCPNAKLLLNDYNILNNNTSTTIYVNLINLLKTRGLIDGVGEQGHFLETTPLATIATNLDKLAGTEFPIHISEFDLDFTSDAEQKTRYEQLVPLLWEHPSVHGITLWGYKQGEIWRTNAYLLRSNGTERPAMTWIKDYITTSDGGVLCTGVVGVEDEFESNLKVYPNPTSNNVVIEMPSEGYRITVVDPLGRVVNEMHGITANTIELQIGDQKGFYILLFTSPKGTTSFRKIIKK